VIWRIFVIVALALVVGVSIFNNERRRPAPDEPSTPSEPLQPGYFMLGAHIIETGEDGQPLYRLNAEEIRQRPFEGGIELEGLSLAYRPPGANDWTVTAERGFVPAASRVLNLSGDVRIVGQPATDAQPAVIRTERLMLNTNTNIASTRDRVDIEWGSRRLSTMGLVADLKAEKLQLESAVHGRFVPSRP
jgi:LPS export ABC transporter protein LptC